MLDDSVLTGSPAKKRTNFTLPPAERRLFRNVLPLKEIKKARRRSQYVNTGETSHPLAPFGRERRPPPPPLLFFSEGRGEVVKSTVLEESP